MWSRTRRACRARCARRTSSSSVVGCVEVRVERHLRVDDDALAARELHDQVGPQQAAVVVAARSPARRSRSSASIPASSTTRLSCTSPQRPRTCGARSAVTRLPVSLRSRSWPCGDARAAARRSRRRRVRRLSSSACACSLEALERLADRLRASPRRGASSDDELVSSASSVSALSCSSHWPWVRSTSASSPRAARSACSRALGRELRRARTAERRPRRPEPGAERAGEESEDEDDAGSRAAKR